MATAGVPTPRKEFSTSEDAPDGTVYVRAYEVTPLDTLATVNLEISDGLPEAAAVKIISSKLGAIVSSPGGLARLVHVRALALRDWAS